jgi:hypothetical protein
VWDTNDWFTRDNIDPDRDTCESQVITICQEIVDVLDNVEMIGALIVDFSNDFDACSKYPDVIPMLSATSRETVAVFLKLWAQQGVPQTVVTENGKQFTTHEFREFCTANSISHILSPPYHPHQMYGPNAWSAPSSMASLN